MVWGLIVSGKTYKLVDWAIAFGVTGGCMVFMMAGDISSSRARGDSLSARAGCELLV